jgi:hypothetical protein
LDQGDASALFLLLAALAVVATVAVVATIVGALVTAPDLAGADAAGDNGAELDEEKHGGRVGIIAEIFDIVGWICSLAARVRPRFAGGICASESEFVNTAAHLVCGLLVGNCLTVAVFEGLA